MPYRHRAIPPGPQGPGSPRNLMSTLWSIYIGGMDEYHAAPSEAAAKHMAEKHNASITQWYTDCPDTTGFRPTLESALAKVEVWPFEAEEHAEDLLDFDYAEWGLESGAA